MNNRWRQIRRLRKRENAKRIRKILKLFNTSEEAIKALTDAMNKAAEVVREFAKRYSETFGGEQ